MDAAVDGALGRAGGGGSLEAVCIDGSGLARDSGLEAASSSSLGEAGSGNFDVATDGALLLVSDDGLEAV